jgi:hypothetical protein
LIAYTVEPPGHETRDQDRRLQQKNVSTGRS